MCLQVDRHEHDVQLVLSHSFCTKHRKEVQRDDMIYTMRGYQVTSSSHQT